MPTRACYFSQLFMDFFFPQPRLISVHTALMLFCHYLTRDSCKLYQQNGKVQVHTMNALRNLLLIGKTLPRGIAEVGYSFSSKLSQEI